MKLKSKYLLTMAGALAAAITFFSCDDTVIDEPAVNPGIPLDTVRYFINDMEGILYWGGRANMAAAQQGKFVVLTVEKGLGIRQGDEPLMERMGALSNKSNVQVTYDKAVYSTKRDRLLTYREWIGWGRPPLGISPEGIKFAANASEITLFHPYQSALAEHTGR
jgi:hypothetical protein